MSKFESVETGVKLDLDTIDSEIKKYAVLKNKTLPRVRDELAFYENRLVELKSKKVHWKWALDLHRKSKQAGQSDPSLKMAKRAKQAQVSVEDAKKAEEFISGKRDEPFEETDSEDESFVAPEGDVSVEEGSASEQE